MNFTIVTNYSTKTEFDSVKSFAIRFGEHARIITAFDIEFGNVWKVADSQKTTVEWTKRFLRRFLEESSDILIKVDPDTIIKNLPDMPLNCDVAGDFRKSTIDWVWLGACQYYTRNSIVKILDDPLYVGNCIFQDIELARCIKRLGLKAYNMSEIDGWSITDSTAEVIHKGRSIIQKMPVGFITMN